MALNDDLATLKSDITDAYVDKMEVAYDLVANPDYVQAELIKAGDILAELFTEFCMPYIQANIELQNAKLTSPVVKDLQAIPIQIGIAENDEVTGDIV